jgi:hypothetical protein
LWVIGTEKELVHVGRFPCFSPCPHLHPPIPGPSNPGRGDESPSAGGAGEVDAPVIALEALGDLDLPESLLELAKLLFLSQEGELEHSCSSLRFAEGSGRLGFASLGRGSKAEPDVTYSGGVARILDQYLAGRSGGDGGMWGVDFGDGSGG